MVQLCAGDSERSGIFPIHKTPAERVSTKAAKCKYPTNISRYKRHQLSFTKGTNQISDLPPSIGELYEETTLKGPPEATIARRAKSYSDFYEVATGFLSKQARDEKSRDALDIAPVKQERSFSDFQYEDFEDDLLISSHEEFQ